MHFVSRCRHTHDIDTWQRRFEDLRRQRNSDKNSTSRPSGIATFLHRGTVAWLRTWPEESTSCERSSFDRGLHARHTSESIDVDSSQLAEVFASMILAVKEVMA